MIRALLLAVLMLFGSGAALATTNQEASPFDEAANAKADLNSALTAAARSRSKNVLVVMGANWCHDSRALAGWFATPRFAAMLNDRYEIVYIDVGVPQTGKGRNLDIAARFGIGKLKSTPLLLLLSPDGRLLNSRKDAISWRNAASRSEDVIYRSLANFAPATKRNAISDQSRP